MCLIKDPHSQPRQASSQARRALGSSQAGFAGMTEPCAFHQLMWYRPLPWGIGIQISDVEASREAQHRVPLYACSVSGRDVHVHVQRQAAQACANTQHVGLCAQSC